MDKKNKDCRVEFHVPSNSSWEKTTFHCNLPKGHDGFHLERSTVNGKDPFTIIWAKPNKLRV